MSLISFVNTPGYTWWESRSVVELLDKQRARTCGHCIWVCGKQQLFLSQGHIWCSYHKVISGVLITRSYLVFLSQGHVWCSPRTRVMRLMVDTSLRSLLSLALALMDW